MEAFSKWLNCHGDERRSALDEAATIALEKYFQRWGQHIPIDLYRLAASLNCRITRVNNLKGEAKLVPTKAGFSILVSDKLSSGRLRTSVAHEIAHTLFYSIDKDIPRRAASLTKSEEVFCFDLARRILLPYQHLEYFNTNQIRDTFSVFNNLIKIFRLSKDVAALVMFNDYSIAEGIAGRWIFDKSSWNLVPGNFYASSSLMKTERKFARARIEFWLENGQQNNGEIIGFPESSNHTIFVVAQLHQQKYESSDSLQLPGQS
jgi:hypothetical protein